MRKSYVRPVVTSAVLATLTLLGTACTEPTTIPGPLCGGSYARADYCKETCAAESLCPGGDQASCEAACRACEPDANYCPPDGE